MCGGSGPNAGTGSYDEKHAKLTPKGKVKKSGKRK